MLERSLGSSGGRHEQSNKQAHPCASIGEAERLGEAVDGMKDDEVPHVWGAPIRVCKFKCLHVMHAIIPPKKVIGHCV